MHVPHPFALKRERKNRQIRQLFFGAPLVHIVCDSCKLFYYFVGWVDRSKREIWSLDGCDKKSNFTVIARYKFSLKFMWFVCESRSSNNDDCRREKIFHSQTHQFKTILECTKSQGTTSNDKLQSCDHHGPHHTTENFHVIGDCARERNGEKVAAAAEGVGRNWKQENHFRSLIAAGDAHA